MALPSRCGGRRIRENPDLAREFDAVLVSISNQLYDHQARRGSTLQELADGSGVSERAVLDVFKTTSDVKVSTLVRLAAFFGRQVTVSFRTPTGTTVR